jgi:GH24 family phage-related lysozyme (muramidase)
VENQVVEIESPTHGVFEVEAPQDWTPDQIRSHVEGLDLDLMLGVPGEEDLGETNVEKIKEWENSVGAGKRDDKWFPHKSLEGGTDTVAYGHKLTEEEASTGIIKVGDQEYNWREGLSEEAAQAVLNQDAGSAKRVALAALKKANLADDDNKVQALTSLIYNVGSGSWGRSKAKKFLEAGNIEDFMHEAFDKEAGFVRINGDVSRGLQRRRAAEASLFAQGNIDKGDGVMAEILNAINPISTAQASTLSPNTEPTKGMGQLGAVDVPEGKPEPYKESLIEAGLKFNVVPTALTSFAESLSKGFSNKFLGTSFSNVENNNITVSEGDVDALLAMRQHIVGQGRTSFNEKDWKDLIGTDLARTDNDNVSAMDKMFAVMKDPMANMAMTIGAGEIKTDDEGKVYIEDTYDFNEGKLGVKFKNVEQKEGFFGMLKSLFDDKSMDNYTKVRVLGYVLQPEPENKTKSRIYLEGTAAERLKSTLQSKEGEE